MSENVLNIYEKKAEEMTSTNIITGKDKFTKTSGGFLSLDCNGKHYKRVRIVRLFPFSDAQRYLSVRDHGDSDKEIGIIEDLNELLCNTVKIIERHKWIEIAYLLLLEILDVVSDYLRVRANDRTVIVIV